MQVSMDYATVPFYISCSRPSQKQTHCSSALTCVIVTVSSAPKSKIWNPSRRGISIWYISKAPASYILIAIIHCYLSWPILCRVYCPPKISKGQTVMLFCWVPDFISRQPFQQYLNANGYTTRTEEPQLPNSWNSYWEINSMVWFQRNLLQVGIFRIRAFCSNFVHIYWE